MTRPVEKQRSHRKVASLGALALLVPLLSGCSEEIKRGFLPHGVVENADKVTALWNGAWIAGLAVGLIVWGLTLWCILAYRRKKDETGLPAQIRYNVPLEILYTVVPVFMVAVLFIKTVDVESDLLDTSQEPDVRVHVAGKQWSWDWNYLNEGAWDTGTQAQNLFEGKEGVPETLPTIYLPVNQRVEFTLTTRDVIHAFWVPQFLMKLDMMPGRVNSFQVVPTEEGTFQGKCAELCGAYHSAMLFQVKVVSQEEYDAHIQSLKDRGQDGFLTDSFDRSQLVPGEEEKLPEQMRREEEN